MGNLEFLVWINTNGSNKFIPSVDRSGWIEMEEESLYVCGCVYVWARHWGGDYNQINTQTGNDTKLDMRHE